MQKTSSQKELAKQPLTEGKISGCVRDLFHPLLMKLAGSAVSFRMVAENAPAPLPGRPILFAGNHYCGQDVIIACSILPERVHVVAGKQPLTAVDEFFFHANGTIFIDRKDKQDTAAAKRAMEAILRQGKNIVIFPEGTSNVSDALPMYPMKWGVIDVAQRTGAQIIPMILNYDKEAKECRLRFCPPMVMDNISKADGIALLRDTMATVRWDFFARSGLHSRAQMDVAEERRRNMELLLSYKLLDYDYEKSVVFQPHVSEETVWEPIYQMYAKILG